MRKIISAAAIAVAGFTLAGCGSDPAPANGTKAAAGGAEIGAAGTACPMPVSFRPAEKWQPKAVSPPERMSGAELLCEIDAKPAGGIGFVRVLRATGVTDPMAALKSFTSVGKYADFAYKDVKAGSIAAKEVTYNSVASEEKLPQVALAVPVGADTVLVTTSGLDAELFKDNLAAYELAKSTLHPTT
ncbi:lipoprotein [Amycolatopsis samaneae]|uniref:Lipoprotein n=1 Tax=Amycolatopsis samaneae TaxID=664691 RepID=A0ABW5GV02_9PSEU